MGTLHLSHLDHPINAHIFEDEDLSISLLSVSELCNAGCTATFTAQHIIISKNGKTVARSDKSPHESL